MHKTLKRGLKEIYRVNETLLSVMLIVFLFDYILFPYPILAKESNAEDNFSFILAESGQITDLITTDMPRSFVQPKKTANDTKDAAEKDILKKTIIANNKENALATTVNHGKHVLTAYNSEAAQTDASPCITANGFNLCKHGKEDTIAANFLKFNTRVKIPELFGDRVFVVRDRMNKRHGERVDVWMLERTDALKFGVKLAKIEVLEEN
jgi:3D (Asp-Asp-Asp) domain-containing protein